MIVNLTRRRSMRASAPSLSSLLILQWQAREQREKKGVSPFSLFLTRKERESLQLAHEKVFDLRHPLIATANNIKGDGWNSIHPIFFHPHPFQLDLSLFSHSRKSLSNTLIMKYSLIIAALFAASAIAAPCGHNRNQDDVVPDVPVDVDAPVDVPDVSTDVDLPPADLPLPDDSDVMDEIKTSTPSAKGDQAATINNNVTPPSSGGLLNVNANNLLAGGLLSKTENSVKQKD
ncbi:hypothetical protein BC940DRAFT_8738 [Gongronella butleri]|nr:hypothetical protein BC940DRAFT_8738 [Gongronella butleri]